MAAKAGIKVMAGAGAVLGGAGSGGGYLLTEEDKSVRGFLGSVVGGAAGGAVSGLAGPTGGSVARGLLGGTATGAKAQLTTAGVNAVAGATSNLVGTAVSGEDYSVRGVLVSASVGSLAGRAGDDLGVSPRGVSTLRQVSDGVGAVRTLQGLTNVRGNNTQAIYSAGLIGAGVETASNRLDGLLFPEEP